MSVKKGTKTFHRLRRSPRTFCWTCLAAKPPRCAFGRRCVSRRFWETARLASLLGDDASRVASQEIPLPRRGGERSETGWFGILGRSNHPAPAGHPSKGGEFSPDRCALCRLPRGRQPPRAADAPALRLFPWSWICQNYAEAQEVVTMDRYAVVPVRGAAVLGVVVPAAAAVDSERATIFIFPVARVAR